MQLDQSRDYLTWDNTEAVTYQSRRAAGGPKAPIPVAKRRPLKKHELSASGGVYTGLDRVWIVPAALLPPGVVPKPADVLTDAKGTPWTVLEAAAAKTDQTWRLTSRDLVLAYDLRDMVNVERAAISYDAAGAAIKAFPTGSPSGGQVLYAGLPARVQLLTGEIAEERGIRGTERAYDVIVGGQVDDVSEAEDRINWNGVYLDIVRLKNAERIDELPVLECKRKV